MIRIFNTKSRQKEDFQPRLAGRVSMYVCGVTVYDYSHVGHARSAIVFDVIARYFRYRGFELVMAKNFTDIDDKIIKRSREERIPWPALTRKFIEAYESDMFLLKVERPTFEPKATDFIVDIIRLIESLIDRKCAYLSGGDVYFRVSAFPPYGSLSKRDRSEESAGSRVEVSELKENPLDFVLWKSSKPGEPEWHSPWGPGRPGWHIECSAMALRLLGDTIDIHGGGEDLIFPHHENEIAQSEASTGRPFARYWIHNGFVTVNQEKMSKSLGNFFTIREVFSKFGAMHYHPEVIGEIFRYFILSTHYRQPLQFSDQALHEAHSGLNRIYELLHKCHGGESIRDLPNPELSRVAEEARERFESAMDDDFNTPEAVGALHGFRNSANRICAGTISLADRQVIREFFKAAGKPLGLFEVPSANWQFSVPGGRQDLDSDLIDAMVRDRTDAKKKKDFKKADEIRKLLSERGFILEDHPDGTTTWKR